MNKIIYLFLFIIITIIFYIFIKKLFEKFENFKITVNNENRIDFSRKDKVREMLINQSNKVEHINRVSKMRQILNNTQINFLDPIDEKIKKLEYQYNIYYNGVPDIYNNRGELIKGFSPQPEKAIDILKQLINYNHYPAFIMLGRMYQNGYYPDYKPNIPEAVKIYTNMATNDKIPLPLRIQATNGLNEIFPASQKDKMPNDIQFIQQNINNNIINDIRNYDTNIENPVDNFIDLNRNTIIKNDTQNVHDHSVVVSVNQAIDKINNYTGGDNLNDFKKYVLNKPDTDMNRNVIKVLNKLKGDYSNSKTLLNNIINYGNSRGINKNILYNTLYNELASGVEFSSVVCETGIKSRIINSLVGIDETIQIKPTWAIKDEIINNLIKYKNDSYNKLSESEKRLIDSVEVNDFQRDYNNELKKNIKDKIYNDYVKTDLLTEITFTQIWKELETGFD